MLKTKASSGFIIVISPPTLLPCSNQHQHTVKPAQPQLKAFLHLDLEHWFISRFLPNATFSSNRFIDKFISLLCLLLVVWNCINHLCSLSFGFHMRKVKEIVFASQNYYGNQDISILNHFDEVYRMSIYLLQLGLVSPMCTLPLFPSCIKILIINHIFNRIHRTYICFPINELPINRYKQGPSSYFSYV